MSLVSEAHRRAAGERVSVETVQRAPNVSWWLLSLVLALLVGVAATLGWMRVNPPHETTATSESSLSVSVDASTSDGLTESDAGKPMVIPDESQSSAAVQALYERAQQERELARKPEPEPEPEREVSPTFSKAQGAPMALESPAEVNSIIDEQALLAGAQSLLNSSQRDAVIASQLPLLETLDQDVRDRVPTLLYSAHDYQNSGPSKIMINRQWWTVGDQIAGMTVIEIRESSTVFETPDGTKFLQPALSSWVNL